MVWKKGQSGNPKGRPPSNPEVRAAIAARLPKAVEFLGEVLDGKHTEESRTAAAKTLLEWGLSKPPQEAPKTDGNRLKAFVEAALGRMQTMTDDDEDDDADDNDD